MRARPAIILLTILLMPGCGGSSPEADPEAVAVLIDSTGVYSRPISTDSPLAQRFFDQGLRLTWGYHLPEAIASHREALRHDPTHPMIYWGLALAAGPNPNSRSGELPDDPQGEAGRAIRTALDHLDRATPEERAFVEALAVRFAAESHPDLRDRDLAYLQAARDLFAAFPGDPDAGTLLADAYMITKPGRYYWDADGAPIEGTMEAAAALERVMELRPDHPGANHLYIHLFESSLTPERALPAADRLAALMPGVGHVVHMPSHIYVRVGQHGRAIEQNELSAAADAAFLDAWADHTFPQTGTYFLSAANHRRHSYDFIRYSAAFLGDYDTALEAASSARAHEPEERLRRGPAQKTIATRWLVHKMFGRWNALLDEERVLEGEPYLDGMWYYTQGSGQVGRGDLDAAEGSLAQLRSVANDPRSQALQRNANPTSTLMELAALALEGEIREARGDLDGAIRRFESAVAIEDGLAYTEPPDWPQPMRQYLGAALLAAGRAGDAESVYREDLSRNRDNPWSLHGLSRSVAAQGRVEEAGNADSGFTRLWRGSGSVPQGSRFYGPPEPVSGR